MPPPVDVATITPRAVLILSFEVLIVSQRYPFAPELLVPKRTYDVATVDAVLGAERVGVGAANESRVRFLRPYPCWKRHGNQVRLARPRRHVDDESFDFSPANECEVFGDEINVPVFAERRCGLQDRPGRAHESAEIIFQLQSV